VFWAFFDDTAIGPFLSFGKSVELFIAKTVRL
jgi:hypothetical protein